MNYKMRLLSQTIIDTLNQSDLPIEAKRLLILEIQQQLDKEANRIIKLELEEAQREKEQAEQVKAEQTEASNDVDEAL